METLKNNPYYNKIVYYTLEDLLKSLFELDTIKYYNDSITFERMILYFSELDGYAYERPYLEDIWASIMQEYRQFIVYQLYNDELNDINKYGLEFMLSVCSIINKTYDYYSTILNYYSSSKNNLLSKVESISSSKNRFNDTPQNDGTFETDAHTTNITQMETTSSTDALTLINRLDEIQNRYKRVMADWVNEFQNIFKGAE